MRSRAVFWLQSIEKKYPGDRSKLSTLSLIEEGYPQQVRMAYLAVIGSHKVNGVAKLHSDLVKSDLLPTFVEAQGPDKFTNVTNGITPRRWLLQCNPALAELITRTLGGEQWLKNLSLLSDLEKHADNEKFQKVRCELCSKMKEP